MKVKNGMTLRKMPGINVVCPSGRNASAYDGAVMLNDTGAFIFEKLSQGMTQEEIAQAMTREYTVDLTTAQADVAETLALLVEAGAAEA